MRDSPYTVTEREYLNAYALLVLKSSVLHLRRLAEKSFGKFTAPSSIPLRRGLVDRGVGGGFREEGNLRFLSRTGSLTATS